MRLVHATDKTWYTVLYHHTMYVISLSNISIKTNFKQIARVEFKSVQYSERDYILCMTSRYFFRSFTNVSFCVLSHIPMVWCHVKVVRQRTSRATSRHSFITTVWWCNIFYPAMTAFTDQYSLPHFFLYWSVINRTYKCKLRPLRNTSGHIGEYCFQIHTHNYFKYFYHRPVNVYLQFKIAG
jgi:hypothetical protein